MAFAQIRPASLGKGSSTVRWPNGIYDFDIAQSYFDFMTGIFNRSETFQLSLRTNPALLLDCLDVVREGVKIKKTDDVPMFPAIKYPHRVN